MQEKSEMHGMIVKGEYGEKGLSRRVKDACALQRLGATYLYVGQRNRD